jgi:uncharacterized protein
MPLVYFDSSALVKLLVEETGSNLVAELWDGYWAATRPVELTAAVEQHAGRL